MNIPFKAGLTDKQKAGIQGLVDAKPVSLWSQSDLKNWAYATNGAPLPKARTLFIDLGHSTKFPGASGVKSEVLWNRTIWSHLNGKIKNWNITLVPEAYSLDLTSNINLIHRINYINKNCKDGDWVLSIHGNAASSPLARGITTCYMGGSEYMRLKAVSLSSAISKASGMPLWGGGAFDDRTGRFGRIGMVRDTKPPALLIEAGFVTNKQDMAIDPETIAKAVASWFDSMI